MCWSIVAAQRYPSVGILTPEPSSVVNPNGGNSVRFPEVRFFSTILVLLPSGFAGYHISRGDNMQRKVRKKPEYRWEAPRNL
jgi:hypothetical protein